MAASGAILIGTAGEVAAHFLDGWTYGSVSRHSIGNLCFNLGLTASFASWAMALQPALRHIAWLLVLLMYLGYSCGKKVQYLLQFVATALLTVAHVRWSGGFLGIFYCTSAVAIIHCTYALVETDCQWLHVLPSLYSWLCYVLPIVLPLEAPEWTGRLSMVLSCCCLLLAVQLWTHQALKRLPSCLKLTQVSPTDVCS